MNRLLTPLLLLTLGWVAGLLVSGSACFAQTTVEEFKALAWDTTHVGTPLDLSRYKQTFSDEFHILSVTPDGKEGPWFAPVHGPFGAGVFLPPTADGPFSVRKDGLTIRADKVKDHWRSGLMQTVDKKGRGFAQQFGYFEMKACFPKGRGAWPAFWLLSQNGRVDKTATRGEIDVVEWYGGDPKGHHSSVHLWPGAERPETSLAKHVGRSTYHKLTEVLVEGQLEGFHTYGAEVTPEWVIVYFDRKETARFKTLPEYKTPLYMVVDLAISKEDGAAATGPKEMVVEYVAAYVVEIAGQPSTSPSPTPP
jgi:hypothetical protein